MVGGDIGHQHIGKTEEEDGQQGGIPSANTYEFLQDAIENDGGTEAKKKDDDSSNIQSSINSQQCYQHLIQSIRQPHEIGQ